MRNLTLTSVEGVRVGHAHGTQARTGCTVLLLEPEADVACEARGGWPGTYDTHSIDVTKTFVKKDAIFLTGGDIFGFDTAVGVRKYLLERGVAALTGVGKLPGIVGANIYDVEFASVQDVSYADLGYSACLNASTSPVTEGNVGAGIGATVGKLRGIKFACKGGCGTYAEHLPNDIVVASIVITNSVGNIVNDDGRIIAGVRGDTGKFLEFEDVMADYLKSASSSKTTIGVVATNLLLSHEELIKVSQMAHDGLAMSIRPVHMSTDGDTMFAVSTAKIDIPRNERTVDIIGYVGARCTARAVIRSVNAARTLSGVPGWDKLGD